MSTSDDAALFEWIGQSVRVVEGDPRNIKVTTVTDFAVAEVLARGLPLPHHAATSPRPSPERRE
jgi:2-C-methyl-D-erythritol 4-phosphate cytidylyltransferase